MKRTDLKDFLKACLKQLHTFEENSSRYIIPNPIHFELDVEGQIISFDIREYNVEDDE